MNTHPTTSELFTADCPICRDRAMAFELVTTGTAVCGGCGSVVALSRLGREAR